MWCFWQEPGSAGQDEHAQATVVGVAAHYKRNVAAQEELLLHVVKVGTTCLQRHCSACAASPP